MENPVQQRELSISVVKNTSHAFGSHMNSSNWPPRLALVITMAVFYPLASSAAPDIFRSWFTPTVVPTNFAGSVRFEAEITENPSSVVFNYNGVSRLMYNDGSHGDLVAGDGVWTCLFTTGEIFARNLPNRVFRPFLGTCTPTNGGAFNTVAEVWTPQIGLVPITTNLAGTSLETDYVVNYVTTRAQLTNFNASFWANRFYTTHGDKYDFLNFVHIAGVRGNRYHAGVRNTVLGISTGTYSNSAAFGSAGRLLGYTVFPISSFYDGASPAFSHETGHQWINFLSGTPYAGGVPHWPRGNIAINVMGFSIPGTGAGGSFSYTFTPSGANYVVGPGIATNHSTFNMMELYLAGLAAPSEVPTYFVLNNQNQTLANGQVLTPAEFTLVNLSDVVAVRGPRVPDSTNSQKTFRCATIILSEQLLDPYAMSFYDFFTRRIEATTPQTYADGLATGTSNPWFLATSRRSVMFSKIADEHPVLAITRLSSNDVRIQFTGKPGIRYQPQLSVNLATWINDGTDMLIPIDSPMTNVATNFVRAVPLGPSQSYYRLNLRY